MKRQLAAFIFSLAFFSLAAFAANRQDDKIVITGIDQDVVVECEGKGVEVSGSSHKIKLIGNCPDVKVTGTGHLVSIERATSIRVGGVDNAITYKTSSNGKRPKITNSGVNNSVKKE